MNTVASTDLIKLVLGRSDGVDEFIHLMSTNQERLSDDVVHQLLSLHEISTDFPVVDIDTIFYPAHESYPQDHEKISVCSIQSDPLMMHIVRYFSSYLRMISIRSPLKSSHVLKILYQLWTSLQWLQVSSAVIGLVDMIKELQDVILLLPRHADGVFDDLKHIKWLLTYIVSIAKTSISPDNNSAAISSKLPWFTELSVQINMRFHVFRDCANEGRLKGLYYHATSYTRAIKSWEYLRGHVLNPLNHEGIVGSIPCNCTSIYSANDRTIVTVNQRVVQVYDIEKGTTIASHHQGRWGHYNAILNEHRLVSVENRYEGKKITVWNLSSGECERSMDGFEHMTAVRVVTNHVIAIGTAEGQVTLWDIRTGLVIKVLLPTVVCKDTQYPMRCEDLLVARSKDSHVRELISHDKTNECLHVWDISSLDPSTSEIMRAMNSHTCRNLTFTSAASCITLLHHSDHDISNDYKLAIAVSSVIRVGTLDQLSQSALVSGATHDQTNSSCLQLQGHSGYIHTITTFHDCNDKIASLSNDSTIRVWNLTTGLCEHTLYCDAYIGTNLIALSNQRLVTSHRQVLCVWDPNLIPIKSLEEQQAELTIKKKKRRDPQEWELIFSMSMLTNDRVVTASKGTLNVYSTKDGSKLSSGQHWHAHLHAAYAMPSIVGEGSNSIYQSKMFLDADSDSRFSIIDISSPPNQACIRQVDYNYDYHNSDNDIKPSFILIGEYVICLDRQGRLRVCDSNEPKPLPPVNNNRGDYYRQPATWMPVHIITQCDEASSHDVSQAPDSLISELSPSTTKRKSIDQQIISQAKRQERIPTSAPLTDNQQNLAMDHPKFHCICRVDMYRIALLTEKGDEIWIVRVTSHHQGTNRIWNSQQEHIWRLEKILSIPDCTIPTNRYTSFFMFAPNKIALRVPVNYEDSDGDNILTIWDVRPEDTPLTGERIVTSELRFVESSNIGDLLDCNIATHRYVCQRKDSNTIRIFNHPMNVSADNGIFTILPTAIEEVTTEIVAVSKAFTWGWTYMVGLQDTASSFPLKDPYHPMIAQEFLCEHTFTRIVYHEGAYVGNDMVNMLIMKYHGDT